MTKKSTFKSWIEEIQREQDIKNRKNQISRRISGIWAKAPQSGWFTIIIATLTLSLALVIN